MNGKPGLAFNFNSLQYQLGHGFWKKRKDTHYTKAISV